MSNRWWAGAVLGVAAMLGAGQALASYPTGVWTRVDKVVYDNPQDPSTIQIYGAIMLFVGGNGGKYPGYSEPVEGYLYYTCPAGQKATCQMEWKEIENNIGAPMNECEGFGDQMTPTGKLRNLCDPPKDPDSYPIAMGAFTGYSPCQVINDYLATNPDKTCGSSSTSSGAGGATTTTTTAGNGGAATGGSGGSGAGGSGGAATGGSGGSSGSAGSAGKDTGVKGGCSIGGSGGEAGALGLAVMALGAALRRRRRGADKAAR
jgi:MYXO-CTERM domain-containing protein